MSAAEVFTEIYAKRGMERKPEGEEFNSGTGSGAEQLHAPVLRVVNDFIEKNHIRTVVDMGCGDFSVGRQIARPGIIYTGVDLVLESDRVQSENIRERSHQISVGRSDEGHSPGRRLCLIRQVLQHLSNDEIITAIRRCERYHYMIVTEHLPKGEKVNGISTNLTVRISVFIGIRASFWRRLRSRKKHDVARGSRRPVVRPEN